MNKSVYIGYVIIFALSVLCISVPAYAEDIDAIQIKSMETKDISYFIQHRIINNI